MSLRPIRSSRRRSRRTFTQLRAERTWKAWKGWNSYPRKPSDILNLFSKKRFVLGIVILAVIIGGAVLAQGPLFHSYESNPQSNLEDPYTVLWQDGFTSPNLNGWNSVNAAFHNAGGCNQTSVKCLELVSTGNHYAGAISKTPFDPSSASGKEFGINMFWSAALNAFSMKVYLTTNNTIASNPTYDPYNDNQVALIMQTIGDGSNTQWKVFIQNNPTMSASTLDSGACGPGNVCWATGTETQATGSFASIALNFTGSSGTSAFSGASTGNFGFTLTSTILGKTLPPFQFQGISYYLGLWIAGNPARTIDFNTADNTLSCAVSINGVTQAIDCMTVAVELPVASAASPPLPTIDTGGFFGPVIRALINIGVFILNALLTFVGFITPALQAALQFLESIVQSTLNIIGNAAGLGNLGDDLFSLINGIIVFFTDGTKGLPAAFNNLSAALTDWFNANSIYFQWVPTMISITLNVLTFGVNAIGFALTITGFVFKLLVASYVTVLILFYFIYVADDALGGILAFFETAEWLIFGLGLKYLIVLINFGLDILTYIIGAIPKPFIQMVAHKIPRIPILDANARFVSPSFDLGELRSGNLMSVFFLMVGMLFLTMYETATPALPGSLAATVPGVAGSMLTLAGTIPLLETLVGIVGGLTFLVWPFAKGFQLIGFDIGLDRIPVAPGRHISSGPGGIRVRAAGKRFGTKKTVVEKELESLQKQKAETTTVAEVREVQRREEEIRQRELAAKARGRDLKGPRLGPLGPEDES